MPFVPLKKYLPVFLLIVGLVVFAVVFVISKNKPQTGSILDSDTKLTEIPIDKRPSISLIPIKEARFLKLSIEKMDLRASVLDYELLYDVSGGVTQGVPGSVNIKGLSSFETEILLGSESSGKFRYDEGVEQGTITLRFRDEKGKLIAKFTSDFRIFRDAKELKSPDGNLNLIFNKPVKDTLVVMHTIGSKSKLPDNFAYGPYGVFSENSLELSADVSVADASKIYYESGSYKEITKPAKFNTPAVFVAK